MLTLKYSSAEQSSITFDRNVTDVSEIYCMSDGGFRTLLWVL